MVTLTSHILVEHFTSVSVCSNLRQEKRLSTKHKSSESLFMVSSNEMTTAEVVRYFVLCVG